ncbi:hypothetical protein AMTRI_Chr06g201060 [Amborella trichopoda]
MPLSVEDVLKRIQHLPHKVCIMKDEEDLAHCWEQIMAPAHRALSDIQGSYAELSFLRTHIESGVTLKSEVIKLFNGWRMNSWLSLSLSLCDLIHLSLSLSLRPDTSRLSFGYIKVQFQASTLFIH